MATNLVTVFNNHFEEFLNDIQNVFPDDIDILAAKNGITAIKKANPKLLVKIWTLHVVNPYKAEIESGDINFFIEKDYTNDISNADKSSKIMESIDRLRGPVKQMGQENRAKVMKYIQNLAKLSALIPQ